MGFERRVEQSSQSLPSDATSMAKDSLVSLSPGYDKFPRAAVNLLNVALYSRDAKSVAIALGMLEPQLPLDLFQTQALDRRLRELTGGSMVSMSPELDRAIAHFLYAMARARADSVSQFMPALLSFLEKDLATTGAFSYYALMIVADEAPDLLSPYAGVLVEKVKSRSYAVQTLSARIITRLAVKRPAVMSVARHDLWNLYRNSDDGPLKIEAQRAMQVLFSRGQPGDAGADGLRKVMAMNAQRGQSVISRLFFAIAARFLNFWRLLVKRGGESSEMARIAEDLGEVARWVEARFPPPAGSPTGINSITFPDRSMWLIPKRISPGLYQRQAMAKAPSLRPSGEPFAEQPGTAKDATGSGSSLRPSDEKHQVRGPAGVDRKDWPGVKRSRYTVKNEPGERDAARSGVASTSPGLCNQSLLNEIGKNIDDSLRVTWRPAASRGDRYVRQTHYRKEIYPVSSSRSGHYVKKRTPGDVRT